MFLYLFHQLYINLLFVHSLYIYIIQNIKKNFFGKRDIDMTQFKGDTTIESLGTYQNRVCNWPVTSCAVCGVPFHCIGRASSQRGLME